MHTLTTVFNAQHERFNVLGNDYEIFNKLESVVGDDEFSYYFKSLFPNPEINDSENVYAILYNGEVLIPLYKSHNYYLVNENGRTFKNLSFK